MSNPASPEGSPKKHAKGKPLSGQIAIVSPTQVSPVVEKDACSSTSNSSASNSRIPETGELDRRFAKGKDKEILFEYNDKFSLTFIS